MVGARLGIVIYFLRSIWSLLRSNLHFYPFQRRAYIARRS